MKKILLLLICILSLVFMVGCTEKEEKISISGRETEFFNVEVKKVSLPTILSGYFTDNFDIEVTPKSDDYFFVGKYKMTVEITYSGVKELTGSSVKNKVQKVNLEYDKNGYDQTFQSLDTNYTQLTISNVKFTVDKDAMVVQKKTENRTTMTVENFEQHFTLDHYFQLYGDILSPSLYLRPKFANWTNIKEMSIVAEIECEIKFTCQDSDCDKETTTKLTMKYSFTEVKTVYALKYMKCQDLEGTCGDIPNLDSIEVLNYTILSVKGYYIL